MREYEFTFVVQPEISEEGLAAIQERFERTLTQQGAQKLFYEDWGRRRLAYEIQNFQKGHYLVLHYLNDGGANPEMERVARLDDSVLRFLTVLANDEVGDVEARKAEAVELETERIRKAQERAEREAEEAAARAAEAEARAAHAAEVSAQTSPAPVDVGGESEGETPEPSPAVESAADEPQAAPPAETSDASDSAPPPEAEAEGESAAQVEEQPS